MGLIEELTDDNLLELSEYNIKAELEKRGYKYGWYKEVKYAGAIYVFVNPAFKNLVKIGYADDVKKRLKTLSGSGVPDPYHCYAMYSVKKRLEDKTLHSLIDSLDPDLRHDPKKEFYEMDKEKAYSLLSAIAQINGDEDRLQKNPFNDVYFNSQNNAVTANISQQSANQKRHAVHKGDIKCSICGSTIKSAGCKQMYIDCLEKLIEIYGSALFVSTIQGTPLASKISLNSADLPSYDSKKQLSNGYYIYTNYSRQAIIANLKKIAAAFGTIFKIEED